MQWPIRRIYPLKYFRASGCGYRDGGRKYESKLSSITFVDIDHEIISTVILPLSLVQEGHFRRLKKDSCQLVGESMCTSTG